MIRKLFLIVSVAALSPLAFGCLEHEKAREGGVSYTEGPDNGPINTGYESDRDLERDTDAGYEVSEPVVTSSDFDRMDHTSTYWRHRADKPAVNSRMINESEMAE